jgi:cellulose synthase/poly-beta-1,6-N-acetylglucosamine synthase-like glycosyltransferase
MNLQDDFATFVMPHWFEHPESGRRYLDITLSAIFNQTDQNWRIVLIDDGSSDERSRRHLAQLQQDHRDKIHVIFKETNDGPGVCRNLGVQWAYEQRSPFILFNDADDPPAPRRMEVVRRVFAERPETGVVYSTFRVIDQDGREIPLAEMTPSVAEVIEAHRRHPPQGDNAWIAIGTETGYVNHTSSTAVRTDLAIQFPFPPERVSEDSHTWFRYSAGGGPFVYVDEPLSTYRNTRDVAGSLSRAREGGKRGFYATKARVDTAGFREAMEIALANQQIQPDQAKELLINFYLRLGQTLAREGHPRLASDQFQAALAVSPSLTQQLIIERRLAGQMWIQEKES